MADIHFELCPYDPWQASNGVNTCRCALIADVIEWENRRAVNAVIMAEAADFPDVNRDDYATEADYQRAVDLAAVEALRNVHVTRGFPFREGETVLWSAHKRTVTVDRPYRAAGRWYVRVVDEAGEWIGDVFPEDLEALR